MAIIKSIVAKCPTCGAHIKQPDLTQDSFTCEYCQATILMDDFRKQIVQTPLQPQQSHNPHSPYSIRNIVLTTLILAGILIPVFAQFSSPPPKPRQSLSAEIINHQIDKMQKQGLGVTVKKAGKACKSIGKFLAGKVTIDINIKKEIYIKLCASDDNERNEEPDNQIRLEEVSKEYNISEKQIRAIHKEGIKKEWPVQ